MCDVQGTQDRPQTADRSRAATQAATGSRTGWAARIKYGQARARKGREPGLPLPHALRRGERRVFIMVLYLFVLYFRAWNNHTLLR